MVEVRPHTDSDVAVAALQYLLVRHARQWVRLVAPLDDVVAFTDGVRGVFIEVGTHKINVC